MSDRYRGPGRQSTGWGEHGWWIECDADHPSAEPATVWSW